MIEGNRVSLIDHQTGNFFEVPVKFVNKRVAAAHSNRLKITALALGALSFLGLAFVTLIVTGRFASKLSHFGNYSNKVLISVAVLTPICTAASAFIYIFRRKSEKRLADRIRNFMIQDTHVLKPRFSPTPFQRKIGENCFQICCISNTYTFKDEKVEERIDFSRIDQEVFELVTQERKFRTVLYHVLLVRDETASAPEGQRLFVHIFSNAKACDHFARSLLNKGFKKIETSEVHYQEAEKRELGIYSKDEKGHYTNKVSDLISFEAYINEQR